MMPGTLAKQTSSFISAVGIRGPWQLVPEFRPLGSADQSRCQEGNVHPSFLTHPPKTRGGFGLRRLSNPKGRGNTRYVGKADLTSAIGVPKYGVGAPMAEDFLQGPQTKTVAFDQSTGGYNYEEDIVLNR